MVIIASFCFFLLIFVAIGVLSTLKSKGNNEDYLLAGHSVSPWLVALSAIATNNSGFMFIGQIGFTYKYGLSTIWMLVGWITGDFIASLFIHKKLRMVSEEKSALSFGGVLSRWHNTDFRRLRLIIGLLTVILLGTYAAAQFKAGSKALHVLFGWDYKVGAIIGSVIVFLYCLAGGIRASIWTDAAQSFVMILAMAVLFIVGIMEVGGWSQYVAALHDISPNYMSLMPPNLLIPGIPGAVFFVLGWFFAGLGVIGQPHIMIRFMTLDDPGNINRVRAYYYSWYFFFFALTIGVAMTARLLIPESGAFDPELALPTIAQDLLPKVLVGLVLAGLFAATMSTADSLVLSCSASLTRDIVPKELDNHLLTKAGTAIVTITALFIALFGSDDVFVLVLFAFGVLASSMGPLLALYAFNVKVTETTAVLMVFVGTTVAVFWRIFGLATVTYEILPGMVSGFVTFALCSAIGWNDPQAIEKAQAEASES